jgi:hypothetical protein
MSLFHCLGHTKVSVQVQGFLCVQFIMIHLYSEELLTPHQTPKLENHPLSAVCDCLFHVFAATLHIGGRSSVHNLRKHHAMVMDPLIISGQNFAIVYKYFSTAWTFMCSVIYLEFNLKSILPNSGTFPLGHFEYNSLHSSDLKYDKP